MDLITAFERGKIKGISGLPEKIVETWQSKIFFYGDDVYKVYKHEKNQFVNLSSPKVRQNFYQEDFSWNNLMSPSIYISLEGLKEEGGLWSASGKNKAEDYYIFMRRIDEVQEINKKLQAQSIKEKDIERLTIIMTERLKNLTAKKKNELTDVFSLGWPELLSRRIDDAREFSYSAEKFINKSKTDKIIKIFQNFLKSRQYFKNFSSRNLEVAIDNHSDNIIILEKEIIFVDVYIQKRNWRVVDRNFNIARLAADVSVQGKRQYAQRLYETYHKIALDFPEEIAWFYELYNALLKAAYLYLTKQSNLAKKYILFIDNNLDKIKN